MVSDDDPDWVIFILIMKIITEVFRFNLALSVNYSFHHYGFKFLTFVKLIYTCFTGILYCTVVAEILMYMTKDIGLK